MQPRLTRRFLLGTALATSLVTATGARAFERTANGNVIVFGGRQAIPVLDPHVRYDWSTRMAQQAFYDALFKYEGDPAEIKPWLAESWDISEDGRIWTIKIVDGVKFHNGDPLDAEAVRYSFERGLRLNKGVAWMYSAFLPPENITVIDPLTVQFELSEPFAAFQSFLPWWYIVNPAQVQANEVDGDWGQAWLVDHEAGSGPFEMGRWQPNALYEMVARKDYWKGWPQGDKAPAGVIYRIITEPAAQKAALLRGEADIVEGLTSDDYVQMARQESVVIQNHQGMTTFGIKFNTQRGPTADLNLRKAIAYAMDYDALVAIYNGDARLETSPFPQGMMGHIDVADIPRQDLEKAREYMAKTEWANGGLTLQYVHLTGLEEARRIGLVLLDNLKELGITVEMVSDTWPNMVARGADVETSPNMTSVFTTPISTDPDSVAYQYHPSSHGQYYAMHFYNNPEVAEWIEQARAATEWDTRAELYAKVQTQVVADQPEIFGMLQNRRWAHQSYLKGFNFSPVRFTGEVDLYPLWIEA